MASVRVIGIDENNHAGYSKEHSFILRDPDSLYAELIEPSGRRASLQISQVDSSGAITGVKVLDPGFGYEELSWNYSIISFNGVGAVLEATLDGNGSVVEPLAITNGGSGYELGDVILAQSPVLYEVGQPMTLRARVNDLDQLGRVAFCANRT